MMCVKVAPIYNFFLWLLYVAGACRLKVTSKYKKQFPTPGDAERHFFGMSFDEETATEFSVASTQTSTSIQY